MNLLTEWWGGLDLSLQIFYAVGIFAAGYLLLQILLMLFGMGDLDLETDFEGDTGDLGGQILSVRSVTAFMFGFGWTGALCLQSGLSIGLTIVISLAAGAVMLVVIVALMRLIYSLRQDGTVNYRNAVGVVGTVYLPIPGGGQKPGRVEVMVQGRLAVVEAFYKGEQTLANNSKVTVIDTIGDNALVVEPVT